MSDYELSGKGPDGKDWTLVPPYGSEEEAERQAASYRAAGHEARVTPLDAPFLNWSDPDIATPLVDLQAFRNLRQPELL